MRSKKKKKKPLFQLLNLHFVHQLFSNKVYPLFGAKWLERRGLREQFDWPKMLKLSLELRGAAESVSHHEGACTHLNSFLALCSNEYIDECSSEGATIVPGEKSSIVESPSQIVKYWISGLVCWACHRLLTLSAGACSCWVSVNELITEYETWIDWAYRAVWEPVKHYITSIINCIFN